MTTPDRENIIARFNAEFGYGWRKIYAETIGVGRDTASIFRGSTLKHAAALIEMLELMPPRLWPDRWDAMKGLHEITIAKAKMAQHRKELSDG